MTNLEVKPEVAEATTDLMENAIEAVSTAEITTTNSKAGKVILMTILGVTIIGGTIFAVKKFGKKIFKKKATPEVVDAAPGNAEVQ